MPVLGHPMALLGLLGLGALAGIYWLRSRYRRRAVSSLMLWADARQAKEGGRRVERLQTPLLFLLELAIIVLLVLAAAGLKVRTSDSTVPVIVVLDDSYSMQAGGDDSARQRALDVLDDEFFADRGYSMRFVLAGTEAKVMSSPPEGIGLGKHLQQNWNGRAPGADLDRAIALAGELGGDAAMILVVTDHPPPQEVGEGRIQWRAFGRARPNVAIIGASRIPRNDSDRVLLEIANFSQQPGNAALTISTDDGARILKRSNISLASGEVRRMFLKVTGDVGLLRAEIEKDELPIDDRVVLVPEPRRPVGVSLAISDPDVRASFTKALEATGQVIIGASRPDILITDGAPAGPTRPGIWTLTLEKQEKADAFAGPFVVDRTHPLCEGLALDNVIWSADRGDSPTGRPIIMAGDVPLMTDVVRVSGQHDITLRMQFDLSTFQETPNWPILIWNLVRWRASHKPGLQRSNLRLGTNAVLRLLDEPESVTLVEPDGTERPATPLENRITVLAEHAGLYELRADETSFLFTAKPLSPDESDLTGCAYGRWGKWAGPSGPPWVYRSLSGLFLLLALAGFLAHRMLMGGGRRT